MSEIELPLSHPWPINVIFEVKGAVRSSFNNAATSSFFGRLLKAELPAYKDEVFLRVKTA
jgi:hypothetical protein